MDLTLYTEGFMARNDQLKRVEYISVDRLIYQPVTDPDYVNVADYIKGTTSGTSYSENIVTPPVLIAMLEQDCNQALELIKNIITKGNPSLAFEVADVKTWANMGLHFAEKLKGAVALQTYRTNGGDANKQNAMKHFNNALKYWDEVVSITRPLYSDMPLVHYSEQNGVRSEENKHLTFHWEKIRPDVAKDIQIAENAKPGLPR